MRRAGGVALFAEKNFFRRSTLTVLNFLSFFTEMAYGIAQRRKQVRRCGDAAAVLLLQGSSILPARSPRPEETRAWVQTRERRQRVLRGATSRGQQGIGGLLRRLAGSVEAPSKALSTLGFGVTDCLIDICADDRAQCRTSKGVAIHEIRMRICVGAALVNNNLVRRSTLMESIILKSCAR
jgi:hypothetical protein